MLEKIKDAFDYFLWMIKPRFYNCRDCYYVRWFDGEFIIKKYGRIN